MADPLTPGPPPGAARPSRYLVAKANEHIGKAEALLTGPPMYPFAKANEHTGGEAEALLNLHLADVTTASIAGAHASLAVAYLQLHAIQEGP